MRAAAALIVAAGLLAAAPAAGQTPTRPGPWVLDIRGVTSAVPTDTTFYPTLTSTVVPSRGFGADVGGHIYLFNLGPSRVGLGASVIAVRATANAAASTQGDTVEPGQRVTMTLRVIAPQVSFNFGSRDGWSYLSAGLGLGSVNSRTENASAGERESGRLRTINYGGGARWFVTPRLAFGIDLRAHQFSASAGTPRVSVFAASAGVSFRK